MDGPNSPLTGYGDNRMRARPRPVARFQTLVESSMSNETKRERERERGGSFTERRILANYQNPEKSIG